MSKLKTASCTDNRCVWSDEDPFYICIESTKFWSVLQNARQYRITGSRCYAICTYSKNRKADWRNKSCKYFNSDNDKSNKFTNHGIKLEPLARKTYEDKLGIKVFQCGLVISSMNP